MIAHEDDPGGHLYRRAVRSLRQRTDAPALETLAFWVAIALPAIYLPLLAAGIHSTGRLLLFFALFALHVLALVGGRSHSSEASA